MKYIYLLIFKMTYEKKVCNIIKIIYLMTAYVITLMISILSY